MLNSPYQTSASPTPEEIEYVVNEFVSERVPQDRYASYDYCYNYFYTNKGQDITRAMEQSCMAVGFYLASWGMFRGSSFLLQHSLFHFKKLIEYIANCPASYWEIDADSYTPENIETIMQIYSDISNAISPTESKGKGSPLSQPSDTLVTKIMLGVFGIVPAYDTYFTATFKEIFSPCCKFSCFNKTSLQCIRDFYEKHQNTIATLAQNTFTLDFTTGKETNIPYTKAKIIDMFGVNKGFIEARNTF